MPDPRAAFERAAVLEVARREVLFRAFIENAPAPLGMVRGPAIVLVNRAYKRLFGLPDGWDPEGHLITEHLAPEVRETVVAYTRLRAEGKAAPAEYDSVGLRSDGTTFPMHVEAAVTELADGPATLASFTDLTACRRAEAEARRTEAFFRAVLEKSADTWYVLSPDRRFMYTSENVRRTFGWTEEEARARPPGAFDHPEDAPRVQAAVDHLLRKPGAEVRGIHRILHKDGSWRWVESVARNAVDDPLIRGIIVNSRDVTRHQLLEERLRQAQKVEAVGRLAGGVAHDFNNVLTVILSCGAALRRAVERCEPVGTDDVDEIVRAAERAAGITRQLLAFARKQVTVPAAVDLNASVAAARKMLARLLGEDVALAVSAGAGLWPVWADPAQIDQVLLNLVANARDAVGPGGHVEVATANLVVAERDPAWPDLPPGQYVRLAVRDDGAGMAPEVRDHAFDPFFTTKPVGKGTGLGLATVHGIVAEAGGRIRVETEPGVGTLFEIALPRSQRPVVDRRPEVGPAAAGESRSVLLVEDDPAVRKQALRVLAAAGYDVYVAGDGGEAVGLAGALERSPDLLLTDLVMPRWDGALVASALRARWPGLPVLYMTGYTDGRTALEAQDGVDLLRKPFTPETLLRRVAEAIRGSASAPAPGER